MKWGKAGQRLTAEQLRQRQQRRALQAVREKSALDANTAEAFDMWKRGLLKPYRITTILDLRELFGPDVDKACGVEEPAVDMWEAAELYPTWEQLLALSKLTNWPLLGFFRPEKANGAMAFVCGPRGCKTEPVDSDGPRRYTRAVIQECEGTVWHSRRPTVEAPQ